ncbi:unnamed protein product (mitochondrion) [Plasmodiophora brassicae]|uniref:Tafazzin family protein n=1 Tax=Plasmodiophora brassicae TaxID=37360 RepID=A0A0G4IJ85_PLABS|nr:hypothetical protein PBRA_004067 [Plasmodiophora brassicae]SPQ96252.1 unnamed protein product [Plasmodiophora brassicae]
MGRWPVSGSATFPWPANDAAKPDVDRSLLQDLFQSIFFVGVGAVSRALLFGLNDTRVYNGDQFVRHITERSVRQPMITVMNHNSTIDDPVLLAAIAPVAVLRDPDRCNWSWCASEICFKNSLCSAFFGNCKTIPIVRGAGLLQPGVGRIVKYGCDGQWINVFPEGKVIQSAANSRLALHPLRWGVGKVAVEIGRHYRRPIIIPIVHRGMQDVLPLHTWMPRFGHRVRVLCGNPIEYDDLVEVHANSGAVNDEPLYAAITRRIQDRLQEMTDELDQLIQEEEERNNAQ